MFQFSDRAHDHLVFGIDAQEIAAVFERGVPADVGFELRLHQLPRASDVAVARGDALAGGVADEVVDESPVGVEQCPQVGCRPDGVERLAVGVGVFDRITVENVASRYFEVIFGQVGRVERYEDCLLYTSDAADE